MSHRCWKITKKLKKSGCGAVGSARSLGACPAVIAKILQKSRKAFVYADFRGFIKIKNSVKNRFDHSLSHNWEKFNKYPGVAQLGARVVWDHQAAGSIPVTRTKKAQDSMFLSLFSIYEGWRKPSALALYDHPNKLEFIYLNNLQISTLKRYLLTHSPFSIWQQRFLALNN